MNTTPSVSEYDDNEIVNDSPNEHMDAILAARLSRRGALKGGIGATTAALLGVHIGRRTRDRMSPSLFRRWFFVAMLAVGLYMSVRGLLAP